MNIFLRWFINAASILIAAYLIPQVSVSGIWAALILALALGFLNITIKPILKILGLPISIFFHSLVVLIINIILLWLFDKIINDVLLIE